MFCKSLCSTNYSSTNHHAFGKKIHNVNIELINILVLKSNMRPFKQVNSEFIK